MKLETGHPDDSGPQTLVAASGTSALRPLGAGPRPRFKALAVFTIVLILAFAVPLFKLAVFALHSELYSYILLIPVISGYLIWSRRDKLAVESRPSPRSAGMLFAVGALVLAAYWMTRHNGRALQDSLAATTFSFLLFWFGGAFMLLGANCLRVVAFPVAFLLFSIPFPHAMQLGIETFFQQASTAAAAAMLRVSGMPALVTGTHFQLPGFALEVAPECSGIHSSVILVITSLLAVYLFLRSPVHRAVLVLAVIPLAILRNGFRVFVIAQLCVRIGPQMIDSPIHRHGGPLFFLLSLIPLFLLLIYLNKRELKKAGSIAVSSPK